VFVQGTGAFGWRGEGERDAGQLPRACFADLVDLAAHMVSQKDSEQGLPYFQFEQPDAPVEDSFVERAIA
jgi:hypothetical protein